MTEYVGRVGRVSADIDPRRAVEVVRPSQEMARCHPDRLAYRVGLCQHCYAEVQRDRRRSEVDVDARIVIREGLSPRELEIVSNVSAGATNNQIAHLMGISEQTVKNHMSSILRKTGLPGRAAVAAYAARAGFMAQGLDEATATMPATPVLPLDVWAEYFETMETNLDRLRQDINGLMAKVREARRLVYEPTVREPRFTGKPDRIVPTLKGRSKKARCRAGHLFTEANTRITSVGGRHCRACAAAKAKAVYRAMRLAAGKTVGEGRWPKKVEAAS